MLVTISPAKRLDWNPVEGVQGSEPEFLCEANKLARIARKLKVADLRRLMSISEDLAKLNRDRFAAFVDAPDGSLTKPSAMAFAGDTYVGLEAKTLDADALRWAQDHLRILSGLYGVLRPLDLIQPYRLEMGSRLKTPRGASLYDWWGDRVAGALNTAAERAGTAILVNCASVEYFGAVDLAALRLRVITPVFWEVRGGERKIISFLAKRARGAMARFIVENRLHDPEALKAFDAGGYAFAPGLSEGDRWAFVRAVA